MKKVTQKRLLTGIKKIHREYKNSTHVLDLTSCPLCRMYDSSPFMNGCDVCPMSVFKGEHGYPCMNRKCRPVNCQGYFMDRGLKDKFLPLDIDFYGRFIKKVETMTDEDMQAPNAWKFLKALDARVYKKHSEI
jgi:hypothetical protein